MAALIILAVLGAFGLLCAVWVLFGFLLPGQRGAAAVLLCHGEAAEEAVLRRYLWLYNIGLIRCPLLLVDCGLSRQDRARLEKFPFPDSEERIFSSFAETAATSSSAEIFSSASQSVSTESGSG